MAAENEFFAEVLKLGVGEREKLSAVLAEASAAEKVPKDEKVAHGHGFVAMRAESSWAKSPAPGIAVLAPLLSDFQQS
jgi:hypothetical protein